MVVSITPPSEDVSALHGGTEGGLENRDLFYFPDMGDLPEFDLPEDLELPNIASDLQVCPLLCHRPLMLTTPAQFQLAEAEGATIVPTLNLAELPEEGRVSRHNLYVVYLVRDPRAVMVSRGKLGWCSGPDCADVGVHCGQLEQDMAGLDRMEQVKDLKNILVSKQGAVFIPLALSEENKTVSLFCGILFTFLR